MGGLLGGVGALNLGDDGFGGGGGLLGGEGGGGGGMGYLGGGRRRGPLGGQGNGGSPFLGRGMDAAFMEPCEGPYFGQDMGLGAMRMGFQDRLGGGRPLRPGGMGIGPGVGGGSRTPSLNGSNYSLDHLDRRPRPYHYQPPYVEDWESMLEEAEMMEMLERRDGLMNGADLYGPLPVGYDLDDLVGGVGGMGGMGGRRARL